MTDNLKTHKESETYVSKGAVGCVVALLLVGMYATSTYALRDQPGPRTAATVNAGDAAALDMFDSQPAQASQADVGTHETARRSSSLRTPDEGSDFRTEGQASFYGLRFKGRPTANGEIFDPQAMTAAHRTLPFGTRLRVINTSNGRSVVVRINDRGPYAHGRIIDLSRAAAERLEMIHSGTAPVRLEHFE